MNKITPFLWFDDQAEQAARFYVSAFKKGSKITSVTRTPPGAPGAPNGVMMVSFTLCGQDFMALNGGPQYAFTPAISLYVDCKTQKEIDALWAKLAHEVMMCGWCTDKFGITWQIIPSNLTSLISSPAGMQAMLKMKKLDIATLKAANKKKAA